MPWGAALDKNGTAIKKIHLRKSKLLIKSVIDIDLIGYPGRLVQIGRVLKLTQHKIGNIGA